MIEAKLIESQKVWDEFVISLPFYTFFHSYNWGQFNETIGDLPLRYGIYDKNRIVGVVLVVKVHAKRGTFFFVPHGPLFEKESQKNWNFFFNFIKELGKEHKVSFIRISPVLENTDINKKLFKEAGFHDSPIHMSAENSWLLPLKDKSEEQLLMEMRKTTRYEIRRAEKLGVQVDKSTSSKDIKTFLKLYRHTVERTNFTPFSDKYITDEFETFAKDNQVMLFLEQHGKQVVAALMVIFYGKGAYYHQGATHPLPKQTVSYAAQWAAIKEAKERGCEYYNFWGIAPNDDSKHPWYGLSLFKKGFGGHRIDFIHAQDYPINAWKYRLTYYFEKLRKLKRRL